MRRLTITLSGEEWVVEETTRAAVERKYHDGDGCPKGEGGCVDAWTCFETRRIYICNDMADDAALDSLIHEWLHVQNPKLKRHKRIYGWAAELTRLILWHGWKRKSPARQKAKRGSDTGKTRGS